MTPEQRRDELKRVMSEYSVNAKQVAEILGRKHQTILNWRCPSSKTNVQENELRLLKFELEARKAKQEKTPATVNS